jgi:galactokinase/mevalonate kinase-like predicted kinase
MVKTNLIIKCWHCGKEETIVEVLDDNVVDINFDKLCSNCNRGWMIKKELTIKKLA